MFLGHQAVADKAGSCVRSHPVSADVESELFGGVEHHLGSKSAKMTNKSQASLP